MDLYHYTSGQGIFGILSSKQIHCSNVRFLNDPTEHSYFNEIIQIVLTESKLHQEIHNAFYNKSYHDVVLNPTEKYIVSFCKNKDSLSMWNYYAKGNGYNICFDVDSIIRKNDKKQISISKVELIYNKSEQIKITTDFISSFKSKLVEYNALNEKISKPLSENEYYKYIQESTWLEQEYNAGIFDLMLKFKHSSYQNEEEIRLIITPHLFENKTTEFKMSENGVFVQYITLDINPIEDVKGVTIHPLNGELHVQSTRNFLNSKVGFELIEIHKSDIPFRQI